MKLLLMLFVMILVGCSALNNPQRASQDVIRIDREGSFKTTCSGAVEEWANCYSRANETCKGGYTISERFQTPVGGRRELKFKCK